MTHIQTADAYADATLGALRYKRRHGQIMNAIEQVVAIIIALAIGAIVAAMVFNALPTDASGPIANSTDDIESNGASALTVAAILPLALVARYIMGLFGGEGGA